MTDEQAAAYIAGFIDGEGHIGCHKTARGPWTRSIGFCNTDKALIDFMAGLLKQLGFSTRITHDPPAKANWSERWTVYVSGGRAAFERFEQLIPIQAPDKIKALMNILSTYTDRRGQERTGETLPCEVCGKPVYVSPAFRKRGGGRFCSHTCRGLSQRNRVTLHCMVCSTPFIVIKAKEHTARFCSRLCMGEHKRRTESDRLRAQAHSAATARWG